MKIKPSSARNVPSQEKTYSQLSPDDRRAVSQLLQWQGFPLRDCQKDELIDCIVHLSAQIVILKNRLDKVEVLPDGRQVVSAASKEVLDELVK